MVAGLLRSLKGRDAAFCCLPWLASLHVLPNTCGRMAVVGQEHHGATDQNARFPVEVAPKLMKVADLRSLL